MKGATCRALRTGVTGDVASPRRRCTGNGLSTRCLSVNGGIIDNFRSRRQAVRRGNLSPSSGVRRGLATQQCMRHHHVRARMISRSSTFSWLPTITDGWRPCSCRHVGRMCTVDYNSLSHVLKTKKTIHVQLCHLIKQMSRS